MVSKLYPSVSVSTKELSTGVRVAKNSAALFAVAILTKGVGLIVAVLVARYLGPAALGTYAVVMGLAVLLELVAPLGQPLVIIRQVSKDRSCLLAYWLNTSLVTLASSLVLGIGLVVWVHLAGYDARVLPSVYVVAFFLPVAGLYAIAQAVLQGLERMEYLTISAFIGRVLGLLTLWILLQSGVGVVAAFIGYGVFQFAALLVLLRSILRQAEQPITVRGVCPDFDLCRTILRISYPFALQTLLMRALLGIGVVVLPMLVAMETVGMFDAADRVRETSATIIPIVNMAILPVLSRAFAADREKAVVLLEKALKMLLIMIFPFVFVVAIAADRIIPLLYGPGYEAAIPVLRIVIWSQIFFVADAALNQVMIASGNERSMVRRTACSLGANVILIFLLVPRYGVVGAAWAVVVTHMLNLGLGAQFVAGHIMHVNLIETVGRPLLCAGLSGVIAFALRGQGLSTLLVVSTTSYAVLLLILGAFSRDELLMVRQLSGLVWQRVTALKR